VLTRKKKQVGGYWQELEPLRSGMASMKGVQNYARIDYSEGAIPPQTIADSTRTVADRHYVIPSDDEFFMALDWLRGQLLRAKSRKLPA